MSSSTATNEQIPRTIGRVKWFNNKSGFGFITACNGEHLNSDIFVHYSSIRAQSSQYKYLVQGEYVEFLIVPSENDNHKFHATDISGILEGVLMCETHRLNNIVPVSRDVSQLDQNNDGYTRVVRKPRIRNN
jgi:cold shock CspA family protein